MLELPERIKHAVTPEAEAAACCFLIRRLPVSGAAVRSGSMLGDASGRRPPARGTEGVDGWVWILVPDVPGLQCRTDAPVTHTSPQCGDPEIIRTGTVRLLRTVPDTRC